MRRRWLATAVLTTALGATACSGDPGPSATPTPTDRPPVTGLPTAAPSPERPQPEPTPTPKPEGPTYSTWPLGTRPLPLRADGFGEIRPTPKTLRNRRYPTADPLGPAPQDGTFVSSIDPVSPAIRERMGTAYQDLCPVPLSDLRYLTLTFRGFDGQAHLGELVVAASVADDVVSVFREIFEADFPIEEMRLVTTADIEAPATGDGNNTAATVCRLTRGSSSIVSAHALGLAVDVNPFMNPYLKDDVVLPERASAYLDRDRDLPGMVTEESVVVRAFDRIGWTWGGRYNSLKDYQHFSANGR